MKKEDTLALDARREIYNLILANPGLHEREIGRKLQMSLSTLDYHLHYLEKREIVTAKKDGRYTRYFISRKMGVQDKRTLSLLRQKTPRAIVLYLLLHPRSLHKDVCQEINKSPSTTSFHLKKLVEAEVVDSISIGRGTVYLVVNPEQTADLLITYKKTFFDEAVDSFIDTWSSL